MVLNRVVALPDEAQPEVQQRETADFAIIRDKAGLVVGLEARQHAAAEVLQGSIKGLQSRKLIAAKQAAWENLGFITVPSGAIGVTRRVHDRHGAFDHRPA